MDIKEIQEQAYQRGFADGQATLGAEFMCKKIVSCEDASTKYLEFPDGLRLIFREGKYVGWYVCEGHEESETDGKDTDAPTGWIPASQPPEEYRDEYGELILFLACTDGTEQPFRAAYDGKVWGDGLGVIPVTYWMPLPEPPKGE